MGRPIVCSIFEKLILNTIFAQICVQTRQSYAVGYFFTAVDFKGFKISVDASAAMTWLQADIMITTLELSDELV